MDSRAALEIWGSWTEEQQEFAADVFGLDPDDFEIDASSMVYTRDTLDDFRRARGGWNERGEIETDEPTGPRDPARAGAARTAAA